jgi:hypothetical protein
VHAARLDLVLDAGPALRQVEDAPHHHCPVALVQLVHIPLVVEIPGYQERPRYGPIAAPVPLLDDKTGHARAVGAVCYAMLRYAT